jgi:CDP-glucose 4,6-dehydratase
VGKWQSSLEDLVVNTSFWKGKKVLITGHTGFKGSWLCLWLKHLGAELVGVSLEAPTTPSHFEQAKIEDDIKTYQQNICDLEALHAVFEKENPQIVFHLAAQSLVRHAYRDPIETYETNVMGSLKVLEALRKSSSVKAVVMVTTDKCYENREWHWGYRENEAMGGYDPYSSSKGCAELLIASYRRSYFPSDSYSVHQKAVASVRSGNVIGGGDWAEDRLIPDIIRSFQRGEKVHIRSPHATRPWQHVLDTLSGYIMLAEKLYDSGPKYAEAWNFGANEGDAKPVQWIVEHMAKHWGSAAQWCIDSGEQPHEAKYLKLDCSKAHNNLGWWPKWNLSQSLDKTIEWYQTDVSDKKQISLEQIEAYIGKNKDYTEKLKGLLNENYQHSSI